MALDSRIARRRGYPWPWIPGLLVAEGTLGPGVQDFSVMDLIRLAAVPRTGAADPVCASAHSATVLSSIGGMQVLVSLLFLVLVLVLLVFLLFVLGLVVVFFWVLLGSACGQSWSPGLRAHGT